MESRVRIKDVAQRAGVSVATVSFTLNSPSQVSPETRQRVLEAIEELGYVRNEVARQLRVGVSNAIGLILPDLANPFFTELASGAEEEASQRGLALVLGIGERDSSREASYLDMFAQQQVRGLVVSAPSPGTKERLLALRALGISTVLVDTVTEDEQFNTIAVKNVEGGELAVRHLLSIGRRKLAFVGSTSIPQDRLRLEGARKALAEAPGAELEFVDVSGARFEAGRGAGLELAHRPLRDRPDGVFASSDTIASGVLQVFIQERVEVPSQIAVVGFDDSVFASISSVPLTTVRQPARWMGAEAVRQLFDEDRQTLPTRHTWIEPTLVVRRSTIAG